MRKAEKRRLGEERAKQALEESKRLGLIAQQRDHDRREAKAEKLREAAKKESQRMENILAMAKIVVADAQREHEEGHPELDEASLELESD